MMEETDRLRGDLRVDLENSTYWSQLATTVDAVPDDLVEAWGELCDGYDDDALEAWCQMRENHRGNYEAAADFVRAFISAETGGAS